LEYITLNHGLIVIFLF